MLEQHRRQWINIKPTVGQRLVSDGLPLYQSSLISSDRQTNAANPEKGSNPLTVTVEMM